MLGLALLIAGLSAPVELKLDWSLPLPAEASSVYSQVFLSPSGRQAAWLAIHKEKLSLFWGDAQSKRCVKLLGTSSISEQTDCGVGLLSIHTDKATLTFNLATGKLLSTVEGRGERVGNLCKVIDHADSTFKFWDVRTGKLVRMTDMGYGRSKGTEPYAGEPAWDTPRKRLFIIGQGDKPNDVKDIVEMGPGGWTRGRRSHLSDYAMGFAGVVGNPEKGPFAILEQTNRSIHATGLYDSDLVRLDVRVDAVLDAGPQGFLALRGEFDELANLLPKVLVCLSPAGQTLWERAPSMEARWIGAYALVGGEILTARTGKSAGRIAMPTGVRKLTWSGDRAIAVRGSSDRQIECYKLVVSR